MIALVLAAAVNVTMSSHVFTVGDTIFLQEEGGPIGLELTGALHRPFMMRWDKLYLEAVEAAGIKMRLYERYVDDSNQIAESRHDEDDDKTLAQELTEIANQVMNGIKMECDLTSNHADSKLPILDMAVWLDNNGFIQYQHYEKSVASKLVISERSAHSNSSKRSVHIQEMVRRMYNSSRELDWDTEVAPVVSEYCGRMMAAGYTEQYRKNILKHALAIYDDKINKNDAGDVPLNRPKGYKKLERRKMKKNKKKNWSSKNGYVAPIIVPSTPGSILAKRLRAKAEAQSEIKFNIVEKGGITIEKMLSKPNPTSSIGCGQETCEGCKQQEGGMKKCQKSNHMYSYTCMEPGCKYKYIGESSNNFFTRSGQHTAKYNSKKEDIREGSFMYKHQMEHHGGKKPNMKMKVEKTFHDNLTRQITESVHIFRTEQQTENNITNSKSEWHAPSLPTVRRKIGHG